MKKILLISNLILSITTAISIHSMEHPHKTDSNQPAGIPDAQPTREENKARKKAILRKSKQLAQAIDDNQIEAVTLLLHEAGPDSYNIVNISYQGDPALARATKQGHTAIVQTLLQYRASLFMPNASGTNAFIIAANLDNQEIIELFLEHDPDIINVQDQYGDTALIEAAAEGNLNTVRTLLAHRADRNIENNNGIRALDVALDHRDQARQHRNIALSLRYSQIIALLHPPVRIAPIELDPPACSPAA